MEDLGIIGLYDDISSQPPKTKKNGVEVVQPDTNREEEEPLVNLALNQPCFHLQEEAKLIFNGESHNLLRTRSLSSLNNSQKASTYMK